MQGTWRSSLPSRLRIASAVGNEAPRGFLPVPFSMLWRRNCPLNCCCRSCRTDDRSCRSSSRFRRSRRRATAYARERQCGLALLLASREKTVRACPAARVSIIRPLNGCSLCLHDRQKIASSLGRCSRRTRQLLFAPTTSWPFSARVRAEIASGTLDAFPMQSIVAFGDSFGWRAARCPGDAIAAISQRS